MARPGVTYAEVAEAANHLLGQNKHPTIEQIRLLLGTGSSTTIANHLKQWRLEQKGTSLIAAKENIPQELVALLKGLWERIMDQSEMKIRSIETSYEKNAAELQQELQKYKTNNQRWQQLFNQWQQEKTQLLNDKLALSEAIEMLKKDNAACESKLNILSEQLKEKQERISELHRLHTQAQSNLEHYRESVREQRLIEQQQFEQQKQELQFEIKTLKEQMIITREKTSALQQQHHVLQQSHLELENQFTQTGSELERLKGQLQEKEKSNYENQQAKMHWQSQYQEVQKNLESKTAQWIDLQAEMKVLLQQISDIKQTLTDVLDQNKLLGQEKWVLAQEKAQLEGQLKQLQKIALQNSGVSVASNP